MKFRFNKGVPFKNISRGIYIICLSGIAFSLPLSEYLTSVFTILLLLNYLVSAVVSRKIIIPPTQRLLLIFLGGYLVYLLWAFNSTDTASAFQSIRLRLPLLVIPFVLFTSLPLTIKELRVVMSSFIAGVTLSSITGVILFYRGNSLLLNTRDLSPFISHIRLSLMICFSLVLLFDFFAGLPFKTELPRAKSSKSKSSKSESVRSESSRPGLSRSKSIRLKLSGVELSRSESFRSGLSVRLGSVISELSRLGPDRLGSARPLIFRSGVVLLSLWLIVYMFMMAALTGLVILAVVLFIILFNYIFSSRKRRVRLASIATIVIMVTVPVIYISVMVNDYLDMKEPALPDYNATTASGRDYSHSNDLYGRENGYYTWNYICEEELENGWNSISTIPYSGTDFLGHEIKNTLIRYLTSLGLKKDSVGLATLSEADIRTIEKGYSNSRYLNGTGLHDRIYEIIWQIDHFAGGGNPQGHSVTQRLFFLKNGWRVFIRYPWLGTGTGDFNNEIAWQYKADNTILDPEFRRLPHNQFLTSLGTFGIIGALLFWLFMLLPAVTSGSFRKPLFVHFLVIMALSMLIEDTLETHTGITFFVLFYSLLLLPSAEREYVNGVEGRGDADKREGDVEEKR